MKKNIRLLIISLFLVGFAFNFFTNCSTNKDSEDNTPKVTPTVPVVTTNELTNITFTTAEVSGTLVSNGNSPILSSGFCWSLNPTPTITDNNSKDGSQSGSFRTNMNNLSEGTSYYVRAYATNAVGTGYGSEKSFTTGLSCQTMVARHQGYQVWAGDVPYFQETNHYDYFYSIDKYYKLIGESTVNQTFNTGTYKYYVIVSKYWNCVDAIQFADGSYYDHGQAYTLYSGLVNDFNNLLGAPDSKYAKLGDKSICPPNGTATFNAFITDNATILSRGGGLKVIVGSGCQ